MSGSSGSPSSPLKEKGVIPALVCPMWL